MNSVRTPLILILLLGISLSCGKDDPVVSPPTTESAELDTEHDGVALKHQLLGCSSDQDCDGFIQLLFDGTLRVNMVGEDPPVLHKVRVSDDDLDRVVAMTQDPTFADLLAGAQECSIWGKDEAKTLYIKSPWLDGESLVCEDVEIPPIVNELMELAQKYMSIRVSP